jgi:hypothetical protein
MDSLKTGQTIKVVRQCIYSDDSRLPSEVETTKTITSVRSYNWSSTSEGDAPKVYVTFKGIKGDFKVSLSRDGSYRIFNRYSGRGLKYHEI